MGNNVRYLGMTVNERLYASGLMEKFDKALKEKNIDLIISLLIDVGLTDSTITPILRELRLTKDDLL